MFLACCAGTRCSGLRVPPLPPPDDLWPQYEREQGGEEPDWVTSEREQFTNYRDQDKDGKLNKREIGDWVLPEDFDHANAEAKHLIYEADINKVSVFAASSLVEAVGCASQTAMTSHSLPVHTPCHRIRS